MWEVPPGLCPVLVFPRHVVHFTSNMFSDPSLFEMGRQIPPSQWSSVLHRWFHSLNLDILLLVDCSAARITSKKSSIRHPTDGRGVFVGRPTGKGSVVEYYYVALIHEDLAVVNWSNKTYGEHVSVVSEKFQKWANRVGYTATDRNEVEHPMWIIAALFCAIWYVSDGW